MECKIVHQFQGYINGVEFTNKQLYYGVEYILSEIESKFDISVPYTLVKDCRDALASMYDNIEEYTACEIEADLASDIYHADTLMNIKFDRDEWYHDRFIEINRKISDWNNTYGKDPIIKP
jgi:hypothetical protein|nr:MAG TPA: hypothetical protein [Bacteriophage sp.]